ncbi:AAA family ATPase [Malikia spinosa]|uniref:AAA family ATPase n=1 Tax=Malikia spinosa TaxID=86180 RepID=A0A7C9MVS8_9BURK|nr:ATP-binding protein [Malikia spinosa]MYZ53017.1 AAA family ATPase [Malikia spinosa]
MKLRSITIQNFQSIRGPTTFSLVLNGNAPDDHRALTTTVGTRLTKALAILGPNGSGKTTVMKSLAFLNWFICHSFQLPPDAPIPVAPHFCLTGEPTSFEMEFELEGKLYRYRVSLTAQRVYQESLHVHQQRTFAYVFTRVWNPDEQHYDIRQQHFGLLQKEAAKVRQNASLISTAAQYEVDLARQLTKMHITANVNVLGRQSVDHQRVFEVSNVYAQDDALRARMARILASWDLGLTDVRIEKHRVTREDGTAEDVFIPFGIHTVKGQEHKLMLLSESSGTQGAFVLLAHILPVLNTGGVAVLDEMEADLHPHMITPILDLFFSPKTNPNDAQLIFTSHSMEVLSHLHKGQVLLVEKDAECSTDVWRLDSIKGVRSDDNLYAKYMAGAYGAIPQL